MGANKPQLLSQINIAIHPKSVQTLKTPLFFPLPKTSSQYSGPVGVLPTSWASHLVRLYKRPESSGLMYYSDRAPLAFHTRSCLSARGLSCGTVSALPFDKRAGRRRVPVSGFSAGAGGGHVAEDGGVVRAYGDTGFSF